MKGKPIDVPFLPKARVTTVVMDRRISGVIEHNLQALGIDIIKTPFCREVYPAIACHPDILMHPVYDDTIVIAPNVYHSFAPFFYGLGLKIILGDAVLSRNYPSNVAYNIGRVGKYAIHNFNYTDKVTRKLLEEQGVSFVNVKQGYSKCSICVVNEHAVITSDRGIVKALEKKGIDVLGISPGYIDLPGLDYGFIGGVSGLLDRDKLAFAGHLRHRPDYKEICNFLKKHQVKPVFLDECDSIDVGSILPLLQMEY